MLNPSKGRFEIDFRPDYRQRVVPFKAGDGFGLNVVNVRGKQDPTKCPVILVHGAGVRGQVYCAPNEATIVDALIHAGYDPWLLNWRGSIVWDQNEWNLDKAALFDHPQAVKTVLKETGAKICKAIIHCQGSTSFTMSAMAGLVPEVETIISNAVSSHPIIPRWSLTKLKYALPLLKMMTRYLNPYWGVYAPGLAAKLVNFLVKLSHHECNNPVCKQVSFTYGSGFPALWLHENLTHEAHEWLKAEFNFVPLSFFDQIKQCVIKGNLVSVAGYAELPADYCAQPPKTEARFAFFTGDKNLCFLPDSQVKAFEWFDQQRPGYHSLHRYPTYSHLDIFMGMNSGKDVFPAMIAELEKPVN